MYAYQGSNDCAISSDGSITSPASSAHDDGAVVCRWTEDGYRPSDADIDAHDWLVEYLDDDGCLA